MQTSFKPAIEQVMSDFQGFILLCSRDQAETVAIKSIRMPFDGLLSLSLGQRFQSKLHLVIQKNYSEQAKNPDKYNANDHKREKKHSHLLISQSWGRTDTVK